MVLATWLVGNSAAMGIEYYVISPYANTSTAPTFIKVQLKDTNIKKERNLILENSLFANFIADKHGVPPNGLQNFVTNTYVPFMEAHEDRVLDISLSEFTQWLAKKHKLDEQQARRYVQQQSFDAALTLSELGFEDRDELLNAMSNQNPGEPLRARGHTDLVVDRWDPRFIALLLDLSFVVGRGDIAGNMYLYERSQ